MVKFNDSDYTRRDLLRSVLLRSVLGLGTGLGTVAVTGSLVNLLGGCASDPIADSRFGEYSAKTLVSTTKHDRSSEQSYVRGLRKKLLRSGEDGLSFVLYKLEIKDNDKSQVVSPEKAAQILEASILRGEDVSGRKLSSYPNLEESLEAVSTTETFFKATQGWIELKPTTGTAAPVKKLEMKEEGLGKNVSYETRAPIAVIDVEHDRIVGLYNVMDLIRFSKVTTLKVDDLDNLINEDLYGNNERLRESVKQVLRQGLRKDETNEKMKEAGGTLAYLFDSDREEKVVADNVRMFNGGEIEPHQLIDLFKDKEDIRMSWLAFDPETLEPVFPGKFERSYALKLTTDKTGKVVAEVIKKN